MDNVYNLIPEHVTSWIDDAEPNALRQLEVCIVDARKRRILARIEELREWPQDELAKHGLVIEEPKAPRARRGSAEATIRRMPRKNKSESSDASKAAESVAHAENGHALGDSDNGDAA